MLGDSAWSSVRDVAAVCQGLPSPRPQPFSVPVAAAAGCPGVLVAPRFLFSEKVMSGAITTLVTRHSRVSSLCLCPLSLPLVKFTGSGVVVCMMVCVSVLGGSPYSWKWLWPVSLVVLLEAAARVSWGKGSVSGSCSVLLHLCVQVMLRNSTCQEGSLGALHHQVPH